MSAPSSVSTALTGERRMHAGRVASIDVFRGLTMMVMIFVNELSGVQGLPW
jgi:heparan-alpha-glucosaminide N-acetyltransferase